MNGRIIGVVVGLVVLGAIVFSVRSGTRTGEMAVAPVELTFTDNQQLAAMARGIHKGNEDAPITILEFADFQCGGCMAFASMVEPQIDIGYVEPGTAKFVFYDFPLVQGHLHAFLAARAGRCAEDQGMFWQYHDELFRNQNGWALSASAPVGAFEDYAARVGLDQGQFSSCLRSDAHAETVTANMRLGQGLGVPGTPTVMVSRGDGQVHRVEYTSINDIFPALQAIIAQLQAEIAAEGGARP